MLRKLLLAGLCSALLIQAPTVVLANDESEPAPADVFSEEDGVTAGGLIFDDPRGYDTNELPADDELSEAYGIDVEYHSVQKIREYFEAHPVQYLNTSYSSEPDYTNPPYAAGQVSDETLSDALSTVNFIRYLAGLNYNVTLDSSYMEAVQAGALINAVNDSLVPSTVKPEGMSDELFQLGYSGNLNANVAKGYTSLAKAIIFGWLDDSDASSLDEVGHRRWLLNANMGRTGFGQAGSYSGMFAQDSRVNSARTSAVWPAQNTPIEFIGSDTPWSICTGIAEDISRIKVTMENTKTHAVYEFSATKADGYFNVDNGDYGHPGAVIWRPDEIEYSNGDSYEVSINGLANGNAYYRVNFFKLDISDEELILTPSDVIMEAGESSNIIASITPASSTDGLKRFDYTNNLVVNITYTGKMKFTVKALKPGTSILTVTSKNGLKGYCSILVKGVRVYPTVTEIEEGEQYQLLSRIYPNDPNQIYTWTSSDESVVTVNENGLIRGLKEGTANITVSAEGYEATSTVTVTKAEYPVTGISLSADTLTLTKGDTEQLTATVEPAQAKQNVTWATSDVNVAAVDENGMVTAAGAGTAVITATAVNGMTAECTVTVIDSHVAVTGITISQTSLNLKTGESAKLEAAVAPEDANNKNVAWTSSDSSVVTVDNDGNLNAVHAGTAVITVTSEEGGFTAECTVTVENEPLTAELVIPEHADAGKEVTITAEAAGGEAPYQYQFKAKIDGQWITIQKKSASNTCNYAFETAGVYQISVNVTDSTGFVVKDQKTIIVDTDEELAADLVLPENAVAGEELVLTANASGGYAPYKYQFKAKIDGQWVTIQKKSDSNTCAYTFEAAGKYPVNVIVYDSMGTVVKSQKTLLVVSNEELSADITLPETAAVNVPVNIRAAAFGGLAPYKYQFTVKINGKWQTIKSGADAECEFTFTESGTYTVNVTVTDATNTKVKTQKTVTITDTPSEEPLSAKLILDDTIRAGEPTTLKAEAAGGVSPYTYKFTVKIGTAWTTIYSGSESECTYTFEGAGKYTVNITVTDAAEIKIKMQKDVIVD